MFRNQDIILVIGGPGSGKGTHCALLEQKHGYHHISTGDLVRAKIDAAKQAHDESPESIQIAVLTNKGILLPDKLIIDILFAEMKKHPKAKGFLIDGCPRTLEQAELLESEITINKVLYFDTTDDVMTKRMLARGREDDKPDTIARRIHTFHEKTMPVIEYFHDKAPVQFKGINSSGEVDEVEAQVEMALSLKPKMATVDAFEFIKLFSTFRNFCDTVNELEKRYHAVDFKIVFSLIPFLPSNYNYYIIQNKDDVKKVLTENTTLGYQYHNADLAHGHSLNIIALQAFGPQGMNPLWQNIHKGLSKSVGNQEHINQLIDKHIPILFSRKSFMLDIQFEKFMLAFWCEYMFGPTVDVDEFTKTRDKLLRTMYDAFYGNSLKNAPLIGGLACRFRGWLNGKEFAEIDKELQQYIYQSNSGLMHRFKETLLTSPDFPEKKVRQAVLDNAFDLVLVFDFLHNALYETLAGIVREKIDTDKERRDAYAPGLRTAFLFPFRSRVAQQTFKLNDVTISKGSTIYINLLKSGLYHSYGPRACIGQAVTGWVKDRVFHHLHDIQLAIMDKTMPEDRAQLCHCADVPRSPERYEVSWQYPRHYLQKILPHYNFKSVEKFYDVMQTFSHPRLNGYIVAAFIETIKNLNIDKSKLVIVAPEVRGIPIAAAIARELDLPVEYIRKEGKIPGPIISKEYKNAYSREVLEISQSDRLKGKEAILIDDGIASGGTTQICCELVEQLGGHVKLILAMINHTYKAKIDGFKPYEDRVQTLFDFESDKLKVVNDVKSEEHSKTTITLSNTNS